ncbi:alanine racemase [Nakamurella sp. YIM 132087]|uniref:Alanine racemase n=1 Tax=Nakamurella alba TaxID=2665158 RepID=A0A7K1FMS5_9ACTN|nr:alanine racemase [Nakamurella alba]MTD15418.1 alanine racemase [Nakamurella alba]
MPTPHAPAIRAEAVVDLGAVRANIGMLRRRLSSSTDLMAVVKADAYGHGMHAVARAAVDAGADALGVATLHEAVELAATDPGAPVVGWLWAPGEDPGPALAAGAQLGVSSLDHLAAVLAAGVTSPRIHVKIDTGLGRNGVVPADLEPLLQACRAAESDGRVEIVGLMSHLASADVPGDASVALQKAAFGAACDLAASLDIRPRWRHLANTPATLEHPETHFDLVRCGIGIYGITPVADPAGLRPVMTLRTRVALTKRVPAGHGVSYGLTYRTSGETTLALVPLGYADGIPRHASSCAEVLLGGKRRRIAGRVAMDQFVLDCGDDPVAVGDEVIVFGPGDAGEPTARDWGEACGTIDYEIVTRIGPRVPRVYV